MKLLVLAVLAACAGHAARAPGRAASDEAVVIVTSNVGDAQLYLDGRLVGPLSALRGGIAIDPGKHRVELRRDDYFSRYQELDLKTGETQKLALELEPVLP